MIISNKLEDSDIWEETYLTGKVTEASAQILRTR